MSFAAEIVIIVMLCFMHTDISTIAEEQRKANKIARENRIENHILK